jgi:hypothetical protein
VQVDIHEEMQSRNQPFSPTVTTNQNCFIPQSIENDCFVDVDLHSNDGNNLQREMNNETNEGIYSQATGFFSCLRRWL